MGHELFIDFISGHLHGNHNKSYYWNDGILNFIINQDKLIKYAFI